MHQREVGSIHQAMDRAATLAHAEAACRRLLGILANHVDGSIEPAAEETLELLRLIRISQAAALEDAIARGARQIYQGWD